MWKCKLNIPFPPNLLLVRDVYAGIELLTKTMGKEELLFTAGGSVNKYSHYKNNMNSSGKNIEPCDPAIPCLGIDLKDSILCHKEMCTFVFIVHKLK